MKKVIELIPGAAELGDLEQIYRDGAGARLDRSWRPRVEAAAQVIARAARGEAAVYGVNTGFGKLAQTRIAAADTEQLQRNLVLSHSSGVGEPLPAAVVRLMMSLKLLSLGRGASGVRWAIIEQIEDMLAHDVLPVVPAQGSVGASGDLAPLAHMAAAMIGEGEVTAKGIRMPAAQGLRQNGLEPVVLGPKEGIAMINGTQTSTAMAIVGLCAALNSARAALITGALATDAAMGSAAPFSEGIHLLRGHAGQITAGRVLRQLMSGSQIRESHRHGDERVQDPYCIRCQPQVMGACLDQLSMVARTLRIEANAVTDNPLIFVDDDEILSGGNFHGEPVAFAADQTALAIAEIGSIAQRRVAMLVDPALNYGLPAFLSPNPGLNSGLMVAEVTSAALMSENKQRAAPCVVDSTPTSANQEDHVSMSAHGARRLIDMNANLARIIGIELITAAQGVDLRGPLKTSPKLQNAMDVLRQRVATLGDDRLLSPDLEIAAELVASGAIVRAVGDELFADMVRA